ncbi:MAG: hypothetical protein VB031_07050 [Eubacteriaceae bacterium]|nr:hypothetical protein [Eubacteriaceae bacterium]
MVICIVPICIAVFSYFVNGSDYLVGGLIGLLSGPVLYFIWRRRYGGLSRKDPERYQLNSRTGLQKGDMRKLTVLLLILTLIAVAGLLFLPFYENGWTVNEYYNGMFAGYFGSSDAAVLAGGKFIFGITYLVLKVLTAVCGILTVVCAIAAAKLDPKDNKIVSE